MKQKACILGALVACGLFTIWHHANASIVAHQALAVAQDAAFCIQRPWRTFQQKEVSHSSELSKAAATATEHGVTQDDQAPPIAKGFKGEVDRASRASNSHSVVITGCKIEVVFLFR
jgi:hypothetical protein